MAQGPSELKQLLAIEQPIVQAPMAGSTTPALAAAVANAGGLGSLGLAMLDPNACRAEIEAVRVATNRAVNLNFFVHTPPEDDPAVQARARARLAPYYAELGISPPVTLPPPAPPFDEAMLEVVLSERPKVVSFHFGLPAPAMVEAIKNAGCVVMSSATTVAEALWLEAAGADVVIAQGYEAGGHRGTFASACAEAQVGTMALVPQVVDAVGCPVIAAGGIMDGRGIAAAVALGAAGAQLGTAFLGCPEASVGALHRQALRASGEHGSRVTKAFSGRPARAVVNRFVAEMADDDGKTLAFPLQRGLTGPLTKAATERGSGEFSANWAGQGAPLIRAMPAAELVQTLARETEQALTAAQGG